MWDKQYEVDHHTSIDRMAHKNSSLKSSQLKNGIELVDIIWITCCFICCIADDWWANAAISACRYFLFGLLIFDGLMHCFPIRGELLCFIIGIFISGIVCALYNVLSASSHFNLFVHLRQVVYFVLYVYCGFFVAYNKRDSDYIFYTIHCLSIAAAYIVIAQYICYKIGIAFNRIPILGDTILQAVDTEEYFRPSAFFSEPSYFAEICLIDIFSNLFRKRNIKVVFIEGLALAMSSSSLGIVFGLTLFLLWLCTQRIVKTKVLDVIFKLLAITVTVGLIIAFLNYDGDNTILLRIKNGATIKQRTLRLFELFGRLNNTYRCFGIGMQNLANYMNTYSVSLVNEGLDTLSSKEFGQSFGYILCTLGVPGATIFTGYIVSLFKKCSGGKKAFYLLMIELCLTASLITRQIFIVYIAVAYQLLFESRYQNGRIESKRSISWGIK